MQRPEEDLEEGYEAIPPPCGSHESTCRVVRRIDISCDMPIRNTMPRLSDGELFQFEARQICTLPKRLFKGSLSCP
jgi:hypothetical protein